MTSKKKVLVLTAGFGEGHNTAARSVAAGLGRVAPESTEAEVIDLFALCYGRINEMARKAYLAAINNAPGIWQKFYAMLDSTKLVEANLHTVRKAKRKLVDLLDKRKPVAVVSTYPAYSFLIGRIYPDPAQRPFVLVTVVTDSITINSVWHRAPSDYYVVANEETAAVLRDAHLDPERIRVLGFPVAPRFADAHPPREAPSDENGRRVLYMINFGRKDAPDLLQRLLELPGIQLTVTVGRDEELRREVEESVAASGKPVVILGWTDKLPELLLSHHLLISKAGGATVQETIAACTPMIISQIVPGQEEGNAQLIVENRCGLHAASTAEIVAGVAAAFADGAKLWNEWRENISRLSRPDAAVLVAEFALAMAEERVKRMP